MSTNRITVCFTSPVSKEVQNYLGNNLKNHLNVKILFPKDTSEETLSELVPNADILIGWRPSKKLLDKANKLKVFINPGAGVNHLLDLFTKMQLQPHYVFEKLVF